MAERSNVRSIGGMHFLFFNEMYKELGTERTFELQNSQNHLNFERSTTLGTASGVATGGLDGALYRGLQAQGPRNLTNKL